MQHQGKWVRGAKRLQLQRFLSKKARLAHTADVSSVKNLWEEQGSCCYFLKTTNLHSLSQWSNISAWYPHCVNTECQPNALVFGSNAPRRSTEKVSRTKVMVDQPPQGSSDMLPTADRGQSICRCHSYCVTAQEVQVASWCFQRTTGSSKLQSSSERTTEKSEHKRHRSNSNSKK